MMQFLSFILSSVLVLMLHLLDLVSRSPLITDNIFLIISPLHFLSFMLATLLVLMLPMLVFLSFYLIITQTLFQFIFSISFFFLNDTAPPKIYPLPLRGPLPI